MDIRTQKNNFLKYIKTTKNLSLNTIISYTLDLNDFFNYLSINKVKTVLKQTILSYFESLTSVKKLKDTTINRKIISLKQYFNYLEEFYKIKNPFKNLKFHFKKEKHLPKTLTITEIKSLLTFLKKQVNQKSFFLRYEAYRDLAIIDLLISTGIRIGEAVKISLNDINLADKIILIHGKGRKERLIYLSCQETYNHLKKWLQIRNISSFDSQYLFLNRYGKQLSIHSVDDIFRKYKIKTNINLMATPHYLRHTFATNLLANGADIRSVQELLGHENISTTQIYTEITNNRKKEVLTKFNYRNNI